MISDLTNQSHPSSLPSTPLPLYPSSIHNPKSTIHNPQSTITAQRFSFRSYQRDDIARASLHDGAIIAWDPGLGKTMAMFAWPWLKRSRHCLIVAPATLHDQIIAEGNEKFHTRVIQIRDQDHALELIRSGVLPRISPSHGPEPASHDMPAFFITDYRWLGYNGGDEWDAATVEEDRDDDTPPVSDLVRRRRMLIIARFFGIDGRLAIDTADRKSARKGTAAAPAHEILGVPPSAPRSEVKAAYRNQARLTHPDLHPDDPSATARMQRLNTALEKMLSGDVSAIIRGIGDEVAEAAPTIAEMQRGIGKTRTYESVSSSTIHNPQSDIPSSSPSSIQNPKSKIENHQSPHTIKCLFTPTLSTILADCFDCVVCDEAVRLKSSATYISLGVRNLRPRYRLALTGTPIKNRLPDIFHLATWVCQVGAEDGTARWPYGDNSKAKNEFAGNHLVMEENITKQQDARRKGKFRPYVKQTNKITNVHRLWKLLGPVVIRRRKDQIGDELVGKVVHPIRVKPGTEQQRIYKFHLEHPPQKASRLASLGAQLQNLRQAALCHWSASLAPACGKSKWSPKLVGILHLAADLMERGEQLVVFSPFQSFSTSLLAAFQDAGVPALLLDGRIKNTKRGALAKDFKNRKHPVLIAGIDSMGEGHSFECASHLVTPSLSWALDANRQGIERVHRLVSRKDVTIYCMITENTIDERLYSIFGEKGDASDLALDGRLFEEDKREVSLIDILQGATDDFNPGAATIDETTLAHEWETTLRPRMILAAASYAAIHAHGPAIHPAPERHTPSAPSIPSNTSVRSDRSDRSDRSSSTPPRGQMDIFASVAADPKPAPRPTLAPLVLS